LLGINSAEAKRARESATKSSAEENQQAADQLIWFGEYAHGTSVADVCAKGNPFIRLMPVRQQFSHQPPLPTMEDYQNRAKAYAAVVRYMKDNSVRIANLSWSRWPEFFEKIQLQHKMEGTRDERKEFAKQLYQIEHDALRAAIESAPEILFVTSSRNVTNLSKGGALPQSLRLPNVMGVGSADVDGTRMQTPRNAVLDVFAQGYKVKAKLPGGLEVMTMGTSIATAQVTNLAAKLLAVDAELTPTELKSIIVSSSTPDPERTSDLFIHPKNAIAAARKREREK